MTAKPVDDLSREHRLAYYRIYNATRRDPLKEKARRLGKAALRWKTHKSEMSQKNKDYYAKNRDRRREEFKIWAAKNKDRRRSYAVNYAAKNRSSINAKKRARRLANKTVARHKERLWESKNKLRIQCLRRIYSQKNAKHLREMRRIRARIRRATDTNFNIRSNLTRRVNKVLNGIIKAHHTMELVGCNLDELKIHLQSKFKQGMAWNNYGLKGWHIDHIIPCCKFNLKNHEEQRKCFHFTNLQPLWWRDNILKGGSL